MLTVSIAAVFVVFVFFAHTVLGGMLGAFVGKILEHTFLADFIVPGFAVFGIDVRSEQSPAIGAVLGFVGAFFKATLSESKK